MKFGLGSSPYPRKKEKREHSLNKAEVPLDTGEKATGTASEACPRLCAMASSRTRFNFNNQLY